MKRSDAVEALICATLRAYKSDYFNEEDAVSALSPLFDIMSCARFEERTEGGTQP